MVPVLCAVVNFLIRHFAGFFVDFHFRHLGDQRRLRAVGHIRVMPLGLERLAVCAGDFGVSHAPFGAPMDHPSVVKNKIIRRRIHRPRRDLENLIAHPARGVQSRAAVHARAAAAAHAGVFDDLRGIEHFDANRIERHFKFLADDLAHHREHARPGIRDRR